MDSTAHMPPKQLLSLLSACNCSIAYSSLSPAVVHCTYRITMPLDEAESLLETRTISICTLSAVKLRDK